MSADDALVEGLVASEKRAALDAAKDSRREAKKREQKKLIAREWASQATELALDATLEALLGDALKTAHAEREWAVSTLAEQAIRESFETVLLPEALDGLLADACVEEAVARIEEDMFGAVLDEFVGMAQRAHWLSSHWYLTKAAYASQLRLVEAGVLDSALFEAERERLASEDTRRKLEAEVAARAEAEAERRIAREAKEQEAALAAAAARAKKLEDRANGVFSAEDEAHVQRVQRCWRARKARDMMRQLLAGIYTKRFDAESGQYFYENNVTKEMRWDRPLMLEKLFPGSNF